MLEIEGKRRRETTCTPSSVARQGRTSSFLPCSYVYHASDESLDRSFAYAITYCDQIELYDVTRCAKLSYFCSSLSPIFFSLARPPPSRSMSMAILWGMQILLAGRSSALFTTDCRRKLDDAA